MQCACSGSENWVVLWPSARKSNFREPKSLINQQRGDLIVSLSYFANVVEEVRKLKMPAEYWRHLQMRVARLEQQWGQMNAAAGKTGAF
jgi:hypothetical protein